MMIIIELSAMLGPKNLPTVSRRTMRNSPTVQAMGWDPENGCSPAQVLTSYRTYVFSKLPSQLPTLMRKICNGLGTRPFVTLLVTWRFGWDGGWCEQYQECEARFLSWSWSQKHCKAEWLWQTVAGCSEKRCSRWNLACMHVLVQSLQSIRGDFCWQGFCNWGGPMSDVFNIPLSAEISMFAFAFVWYMVTSLQSCSMSGQVAWDTGMHEAPWKKINLHMFNSDKSLHPYEGCRWWSVCTTTFHHRWFVLYFLKKARLWPQVLRPLHIMPLAVAYNELWTQKVVDRLDAIHAWKWNPRFFKPFRALQHLEHWNISHL